MENHLLGQGIICGLSVMAVVMLSSGRLPFPPGSLNLASRYLLFVQYRSLDVSGNRQTRIAHRLISSAHLLDIVFPLYLALSRANQAMRGQ
ncbi:hypothetical protein RRG08_017993 [Elysia crispata]|uniref:Uncharacterized protein n=1 Tax=Elysia crispata TaxID=231223 RepID=A0AAE0ZD73_9GAST|nr:hypothetical protein RRG08_017993 [Elysia crispata]